MRSVKRKRGKKLNWRDVETSESISCQINDLSRSSISEFGTSRHCKQEFVQPLHFDPNREYSLNNFLVRYERHFFAKFKGSQKDCFQELGNFLTDEVKEAFNALGGGNVRYRYLKPKLLE